MSIFIKARALAGASLVTGAVLLSMSACTEPVRSTYSDCTVTDKQQFAKQGAHGTIMRVYATCGEFEVRDYRERRDSGRVFGQIQVGKTYTFEVIGTRNPDLSRFPNIISVKEQNNDVAQA